MNTMNTSTALAEALGLNTSLPDTIAPVYESKPLVPRPIASDDKIPGDAEYARQNIYDIIEQGAKAIEVTQNLLFESQHPRAAEVLAQLLKVQAENVDKLLKIHADMKKLNYNESDSPSQQSPMTGNTNIEQAIIFQGTSDELVRMMRKEHITPLTIDIDSDTHL